MRHTFITSILAAACMATILPRVDAAPPNSMFRQAFMANQQTLMARQQTLISNQQTIDHQLMINRQQNRVSRDLQFNREAPLAQLNRSQAFMGISNAARLNQTALSAQANNLGIPAFANNFGVFPSNGFFNPSAYASMYGLSFNGGMGSAAFGGFPSSFSSFSGFPSSGFATPFVSPTVVP